MTALVSVVVPAFNAAWSIERTLASVSSQTWADLEILVIDDGSTDATAEIVAACTVRDPRIRLVRQTNQGASAARNLGVRLARGEFVAPVDADDLWNPEFVERVAGALIAAGEDTAFAFARSVWIDEADRVVALPEGRLPDVVDYREILMRNPVGNGSACLFRRQAVLDAGGWDEVFARERRCAEDFEMILRVAARGGVVGVDAPLVFYRVSRHGKSNAVERAADAFLAILERRRRDGPQLWPWEYWQARSLAMLWLMQKAMSHRRFGLVARLGVCAYLQNPLWVAEPRAWRTAARALAWPVKQMARAAATGRPAPARAALHAG
jgi:glycosyltransferase involved in cell wall biosynthesis